MELLLLLSAMLFQAAPQGAKPVIDNDRAIIWDVSSAVPARPGDAVVVSLSGSAVFLPRGGTPKISGRTIVIDLKDHAVAPLANKTGYPAAFPRAGSKKLFENDRLILWDYTWKPGMPTPMHFHDKDAIVVYLEDGDLTSTSPEGKATVNPYRTGMVRFNARDRSHTELLTSGKQRAIITELK